MSSLHDIVEFFKTNILGELGRIFSIFSDMSWLLKKTAG